MSKTCGIYMIRHLPSGRVYIGRSLNISRRWTVHRWELNAGRHQNEYLQRTWTRDGAGAFVFTVLEACAIDATVSAEERHMAEHRAAEREFGFNLLGSECGALRHSTETKECLRALALARGAKGDRHPNFGKKASEEVRAKMSAAGKGRPSTKRGVPLSEEQKRKVSETLKARNLEARGGLPSAQQVRAGRDKEALLASRVEAGRRLAAANVGKKMSPVAVEKSAASRRGRKHTAEQNAANSARQLGRQGKPHTAEARAKMSAARLANPSSQKHRAAMVIVGADRKGLPGHPQTSDTRAKISAARTGMVFTQEHRAAISAARRRRRDVVNVEI